MTHTAIHSLLLKRFTLAPGTYGLALLLLLLAILGGHCNASINGAVAAWESVDA